MQGSDEESDVDDEEREVEAYDRKLADAEWVATPNSALVLCCKLLCVVGTTEFKRAERKERRSLRRWKGACCSSHVTRHTLHVTRYTLHVTRYTLHVTRHTSHVTRHTPTDAPKPRPENSKRKSAGTRPTLFPHIQNVKLYDTKCNTIRSQARGGRRGE